MTRKEQIKQAAAFDIKIISNPWTLFEKGAEWADRTMIERACQWLQTAIYLDYENNIEHRYQSMEEFINEFRKAMQDE